MPSLVIHGSNDPLFPLPHGLDTAAVISGSRLSIIEGMGHDLAPRFYLEIIDAITQLVLKSRSALHST